MDEFDAMVHLGGEQNLPNLIAMKALKSSKHYVLVTEKSKTANGYLKGFTDLGDIELIPLDNPFDFDLIVQTIEYALKNCSDNNIAFNITGGTKIMALAAITVASKDTAPYFYINTDEKRVLCWNYKVDSLSLDKPYMSVEDFFTASGHKLQSVRKKPLASREINEFVYDNISSLKGIQRELIEKIKSYLNCSNSEMKKLLAKNFGVMSNNNPSNLFLFEVDIHPQESSIKITGSNNNREVEYTVNGNLEELATWVISGWFEEYIYYQLEPFIENSDIAELELGLTPLWKKTSTNRVQRAVKQEFDVAFTDGIKLCLVEVKTGNFNQDDIHKLEHNCEMFAGGLSCGVLISLYDKYKQTLLLERVSDSPKIALIHDTIRGSLTPDKLLALRPSQIVSGAKFGK